ncbi:MAG: flagellar hook-basal body complex protein FliE [Candidatus Kapabacteria bacterium]|nr:flagellar hook-basal body complex protein FliE [Candidatus Kapabacteria bacterium]
MVVSEIDPSLKYSPLVQQLADSRRTEGIALPKSNLGINEVDAATEQAQKASFTDSLKTFITDVDNQQKEATELSEAFIKGEGVDLHDVMISAEKAKTTFTLMLELRNKFLDVYKETLRMQV